MDDQESIELSEKWWGGQQFHQLLDRSDNRALIAVIMALIKELDQTRALLTRPVSSVTKVT